MCRKRGLTALLPPIPLKLVAPQGFQRYDCKSCGDCCRGRFAILITQADQDRIEAQGWTSEELGIGSNQPLFNKTPAGTQLAHHADGTCAFLSDDNRCRIHAKFGEPAKPVACRLYPFRLIPVGTNVRVDVRFDCPSTAGNIGRPIAEYRNDLVELLKAVAPDQADTVTVPPFAGKTMLTWPQLCRVTDVFERVLLDVSHGVTRRVAACVNMSALLREMQVDTLDDHDLDDLLDSVVSTVQATAVGDSLQRTTPNGMERAAFRQLLGTYGRYDTVGKTDPLLHRLSTTLRMLFGMGTIPQIRQGLPQVRFAQIDNMRCEITGEAALAVERYLDVHLSSMGFFGRAFYNRSYLDGLNALLLTYPLVCWFARVFAVAGGLTAPDVSCVQRALMIVDHQHGMTPVLDLPSERSRMKFLCDRAILRSFVIFYGS